jgi:hypothetical protein
MIVALARQGVMRNRLLPAAMQKKKTELPHLQAYLVPDRDDTDLVPA